MDRKRPNKRLLRILDIAPELKAILRSIYPLDIKRKKIRDFLADILVATFDDDPTIPPLEWALSQDAVNVFRSILSKRSEQLAGFSFLQYLNDLLHRDNLRNIELHSKYL